MNRLTRNAMIPTTSRIIPMVLTLNPFAVTLTANSKIAPITASTIETPSARC
jgi:hypothetical protein